MKPQLRNSAAVRFIFWGCDGTQIVVLGLGRLSGAPRPDCHAEKAVLPWDESLDGREQARPDRLDDIRPLVASRNVVMWNVIAMWNRVRSVRYAPLLESENLVFAAGNASSELKFSLEHPGRV